MNKKLHLCAGDVYLTGYENCDIDGYVVIEDDRQVCGSGYLFVVRGEYPPKTGDLLWKNMNIDGNILKENPNETTLDKYFKYPFEHDTTKRIRRPFIIDTKMDILKIWPWEAGEVAEIVSVSAFEHFEHSGELPHIISEAYRVLKPGGVWKFDFPDIRKVVEQYHDSDPDFMAELIYCNHKNKYSVHQWGYTKESVTKYVTPDKWRLEFKDVVTHCYPMQGVHATRL